MAKTTKNETEEVDVLAPVDTDSAEKARVRNVYATVRNQNPARWERDRDDLLKVLETL